jgi:sterol desaturase/sphingolipid hydroxylase (fatty acid hydroxylase superfamily)
MTLQTLLAAKAAIIGAWFAGFFIAERLASAAPPPSSKARLLRNAGLWLIVMLASPFIVAPMTAWGVNHLIWERPDAMTTGAIALVVLAVDLVLLDIWTYWLHRAYHRIPWMWRLHEVHHRDDFLDTTSALRFHLGEVVLSAALRLIPIMVLALPLSTVIIFETLLLCSAIFHHSNLRLPKAFEAGLSRVWVTPSIHWIHHHAIDRDTNSNYASLLSLWDPVFSSRSPAERRVDMKIGLQGVEDQSLLGLILMPLMRDKK